MTTSDIIKEFGVSRQTINNWIKQGKIPKPSKKKNRENYWTKEQFISIKRTIESEKGYVNKKKQDLFQINNRRYLGSKYKLLDFISEVVEENTENIEVVADLFAGTGVVSDMFNRQGKKVIVNDMLTSNYICYNGWFGNEEVDKGKLKKLIEELNEVKGKKGYVTRNFGNKYFSIENAKKIDAIREKIENFDNINSREKSLLLTSLLYAMDKVANTVGHFDAFRKEMHNDKPIILKFPDFVDNSNNEIYNKDANVLVDSIEADLVYIDPPYNSRGYENAYHVLENIIEWKKPKVEGIGMKAVNRSEKSSEYTKKNAVFAFEELISKINSKYILVSYNNMEQKGNDRSNSKMSRDQIISVLEQRGKVKIFEKEYSPYTTGKSKIEDHKEVLYLCIVENKIIESPLNYIGGKQKLLPQIIPCFPKKVNRFIDLFCGGLSVGINAVAEKISEEYIFNDSNKALIEFYKYLSTKNVNEFIREVDKVINDYCLSNSKEKGYSFYGVDSSKGLSSVNKENYNLVRDEYNKNPSPVLFYILICFGFNNQIRFNSKGKFNVPVGKRDFNKKMEYKLRRFSKYLNSPQIKICSKDFRSIKIKQGDFVYVDPPYYMATAPYNENGNWTEEDEKSLYEFLDHIDDVGAKFALSNVLVHKGKENEILKRWSKKYEVIILDYNYNNSNYQSKAKSKETIEVLIKNY